MRARNLNAIAAVSLIAANGCSFGPAAAEPSVVVAAPTPAVVSGQQQEPVKDGLEQVLLADLRQAAENCRVEALGSGATADEINRPIRFGYVVNGQTRTFERLELALASEAHHGYSICLLGAVQQSTPILAVKPSSRTYAGSVVLAPSLHCPVGSFGCSCNVDGSCAAGQCDGRACVTPESPRTGATGTVNSVVRDGFEFTLVRCEGLLNGGNAEARCTLAVRATVRDMDLRVGGAGGGRCGGARSMMYDNLNLEHAGTSAVFAGKQERGCVVSRLIQGIQATVEVQFEKVPPHINTAALLGIHISVREVGMPDWRQVPLEFRGVRIDR